MMMTMTSDGCDDGDDNIDMVDLIMGVCIRASDGAEVKVECVHNWEDNEDAKTIVDITVHSSSGRRKKKRPQQFRMTMRQAISFLSGVPRPWQVCVPGRRGTTAH